MIIHAPETITQDGKTTVYTRIETARPRQHFPEYLWYRAPERFGRYFSLQSDAFLVAALLGAMFYGEDIQVRGPVSPRLAYHLEEYQFVLNMRMPDELQKVSIHYDRIETQTNRPKAVGTTFTGGVDSLYTLWKHLPQNQPDPNYQVTHTIFIRGFDILHTEKDNYQQLYNQFKGPLDELGIDLIELETNMISVTHNRLNPSYSYGPMIVSAGLVLAGLFQRFYIPSSWDYYNLKVNPHTADPLVDGFLSTDTLEIIHHGSTQRRVEKVAQIAEWELAQKVLWVCLEARFGEDTWNCSWCEKCVRTMIPLYALGALKRFKTFEKPIQSNRDGLVWARKFSLRHNFVSEMFPFVKKHKADFLPWLYLAAALGYIRYLLIKYMPGFIKQRLRRYGYFVTRNEAPDAYEHPEVSHLISMRSGQTPEPGAGV
ncbi:hypothetical protein ACFLZW_01960 [Chloroflexota bacterium]